MYSHDPVENLRRGWDTYVAFGVEHPALYALVFCHAERLAWPEAAKEAYGMLLRLMGEVQLAGLLRVDLTLAAQMYWSAAHGVTSLLVARPHFAWQKNLSERMHVVLILPAGMWGPRDAAPTSFGQFTISFLKGQMPVILPGA